MGQILFLSYFPQTRKLELREQLAQGHPEICTQGCLTAGLLAAQCDAVSQLRDGECWRRPFPSQASFQEHSEPPGGRGWCKSSCSPCQPAWEWIRNLAEGAVCASHVCEPASPGSRERKEAQPHRGHLGWCACPQPPHHKTQGSRCSANGCVGVRLTLRWEAVSLNYSTKPPRL